jgi:hypothetical protein
MAKGGIGMEKTVTIPKIIDILQKDGFSITRNQLWSYVEKEILPHPFLVDQGERISGGYPTDIVEPLRRFLTLRDQGFPLLKAKEILLNESLVFVSEFFKRRGMNLEKLHYFALPNIEVDESGAMRSDRGFSQFFIDLLEATLWRSGENREEQALQILKRQLLKWKASFDAFWQKFDRIEAGDSWKERRSLISQNYSEVITNLNARGAGGTVPI